MKKLTLLLIPAAIILSGSYLEPKLDLLEIFGKTSFVIMQNDQEKVFDLPYEKMLEIDIQTGADIEITGWGNEKVKIISKFEGRDADNVEIKFDESAEGLRITTEYTRQKNNNKSSGSLKLMVPNRLDIDVFTMGGDVSVESVEGNLEGKTMGGSLSFSDLKGDLDFTTMGGNISLTDSEVDGRVKSMGGEILVEDVIGDVNATSMGGKVIQKNVKSSGNSGEEVKIKTMGGPIELNEALNGADVSTMGGEITVNKVNKFLKAETMGGNIEVTELNGWIEAKTMGGDIEVKMVGNPSDGKRDVKLTSMSGDVYLTVPADLAMDIEIEIIYDEDDKVEIESDFNLDKNTEESNKWGHSKKLIATGKTGNGKNKILIKTVNGNVHLKKS